MPTPAIRKVTAVGMSYRYRGFSILDSGAAHLRSLHKRRCQRVTAGSQLLRALHSRRAGQKPRRHGSGSMPSTWMVLLFISSLPITFTCLPTYCLAFPGSLSL